MLVYKPLNTLTHINYKVIKQLYLPYQFVGL